MSSATQVAAMVSLLSDSNQEVVRQCREALVSQGREAEPALQEALEASGQVSKRLLRRILAELTGDQREAAVAEHLRGEPELERGSILLGALVDGSDEPFESPAALDALADQVAAQLGGARDPDRDLAAMREVLGEQLAPEARSPEAAIVEDALLHGVTARRRGIPLPICICWILVGQRLGIPMVGVNFPGHFLLRYGVPDRLLFLDAFRGGREVDLDVCRQVLSSHGAETPDLFSIDATPRDMLVRTLRNLVQIAAREGEKDVLRRATRLLRTSVGVR